MDLPAIIILIDQPPICHGRSPVWAIPLGRSLRSATGTPGAALNRLAERALRRPPSARSCRRRFRGTPSSARLPGEHVRDRLSRCRLLRIETEHLGDSDRFCIPSRSALVSVPQRGVDFRSPNVVAPKGNEFGGFPANEVAEGKIQGRSRWGIRAGMACDGRKYGGGREVAQARGRVLGNFCTPFEGIANNLGARARSDQ